MAQHPNKIVKYDYASSSGSPESLLPFDQPFVLQIDNFPDSVVKRVLVFEVAYINGVRDVKDSRAAFEIQETNIKYEKGSLKLTFPPLKAEKDFNVLVLTGLSSGQLEQALEILNTIRIKEEKRDSRTTIQDAINNSRRMLMNNANKSPYTHGQIAVWLLDDAQFIDTIYTPLVDNIRHVRDTVRGASSFLQYHNYFSQKEINRLSNAFGNDMVVTNRLFLLQQIFNDDTFDDLATGQLAPDYSFPIKREAVYKVKQRIANLNKSIAYFNTVRNCIDSRMIFDTAGFNGVRDSLDGMVQALRSNVQSLNDESRIITNYIQQKALQANWIGGNTTISGDFQTVSKRHITVNVGITNIGVYNNARKFVQMQKLFIGANFFFKGIDKTQNFKYVKPVPDADDNFSHALESRNDFFHRLSFTVGITVGGSYKDKDFDNLMGSFSLIAGPSYQLFPGGRIGAGIAVIRRTNGNVLQSDKKPVVGYSVALSLDQDLLDAAKSIVSKVFN